MKSLTNVNSPNLRQALRTIVKAYNLLLSKLTPDLQVVVRTRPRLTIYVKKKPTRTPSIYVARIWKIVKILAEIAKRLPPEKIAQWVGGIVITTETGGKLIFKQGWERPLPPLAALIKEFLPRLSLIHI